MKPRLVIDYGLPLCLLDLSSAVPRAWAVLVRELHGPGALSLPFCRLMEEGSGRSDGSEDPNQPHGKNSRCHTWLLAYVIRFSVEPDVRLS